MQDDERVPSAADDRDRRRTRHGAVDRGNTRARPVHGHRSRGPSRTHCSCTSSATAATAHCRPIVRAGRPRCHGTHRVVSAWRPCSGSGWSNRAAGTDERIHSTYLEVRFEQLIGDPRAALTEVGRFIDHDLDVDRIAANPVHALKNAQYIVSRGTHSRRIRSSRSLEVRRRRRYPSVRGADRVVSGGAGIRTGGAVPVRARVDSGAADASHVSRHVQGEASSESPHAAWVAS